MTEHGWSDLREVIDDRFYDLMLSTIECGPFDGGCVAVAFALQQVIGGEVVVCHRADGGADHAAIRFGGLLWDYDGPAAEVDFIERFNRNEMALCVGARPYVDGDLPEASAVAGSWFVEEIATLLREGLEATAAAADVKRPGIGPGR